MDMLCAVCVDDREAPDAVEADDPALLSLEGDPHGPDPQVGS